MGHSQSRTCPSLVVESPAYPRRARSFCLITKGCRSPQPDSSRNGTGLCQPCLYRSTGGHGLGQSLGGRRGMARLMMGRKALRCLPAGKSFWRDSKEANPSNARNARGERHWRRRYSGHRQRWLFYRRRVFRQCVKWVAISLGVAVLVVLTFLLFLPGPTLRAYFIWKSLFGYGWDEARRDRLSLGPIMGRASSLCVQMNSDSPIPADHAHSALFGFGIQVYLLTCKFDYAS